MINPNKTLSLAIMSGKGGVGKTSISLNLGYALYQAGLKTLLMDCDLGLANLDVLLGLAPEKNLQDLLKQDTKTADVAVAVEQNGLDVLPAASGVPELVDMDEDMQNVLLEKNCAACREIPCFDSRPGCGHQPHSNDICGHVPIAGHRCDSGAYLAYRRLRRHQGAGHGTQG